MRENRDTMQNLEWGEEVVINDHITTAVEELMAVNAGYRLPSYEELIDGLNEDPNHFTIGLYVVGDDHGIIKYYDLSTRQFVTSPAGTIRCRLVKE